MTHNLLFLVIPCKLLSTEAVLQTITLGMASPKVLWYTSSGDSTIRVQHTEVAVVAGRSLNAVVAGRSLNAVDALMDVGIRLVKFVKHACTQLTIVGMYESISNTFYKI